jgi:hypothetical protein
MVRSSLSHGTPASRLFFALVASAWALLLMPVQVVRAEPSPTLSAEDRKSLEIAFELLENSLSAEAELKWLVIFKKLTFQGPAKEVEGIMKKIQRASETRAKEFQSLRKLAPSVTAEPPPSPMGDAIETAAQEAGTEELIFSSGVFNIRFLFLQAQATRMISVVAEQAAKVDPNDQRSGWLREVSNEFENYRDELVDIAKLCSIK